MDKKSYDQIDREIETGHLYVNLHLALQHAKDESQASEIKFTMAALLKASRYLSTVLDSYGPHDLSGALTFLANRACRDRVRESIMVLNRVLPLQRQPHHLSYCLGEVAA